MNEEVYLVEGIDEDVDFGCEERADDMPVPAVVRLLDAKGNRRSLKMADCLLRERGIDQGSRVVFAPDGTLVPAENIFRDHRYN